MAQFENRCWNNRSYRFRHIAVCLSAALYSSSALCQAAYTAPNSQAPVVPDAGTTQDIIVTANRRDESISRVSSSIAAYNQRTLDQQGIRDFGDLVRQTPGLNLLPQSTFQPPNIAIRGIQSVTGAATTGIYIDDTPIQARNNNPSEPGDPLPTIFDLERVEILRGPQGTLFGAGSEGGAVRFISPTPNLDRTTVYGRAELATIDNGGTTYEAGLAFGTPIIEDKLGVRMSASYRHNGGWVDRIDERNGIQLANNSNSSVAQTVKVAAQFVPSETVRITPSLNYQETRLADAGQYYVRLSDPSRQRQVSGRTLQQPSTDRFYLPALKVAVDAGSVTFTSVTSYFARNQFGQRDFSLLDAGLYNLFRNVFPVPTILPAGYPGAASITTLKQNSLTQEIRLQSVDEGARLSWLIGGFYQHSVQRSTTRVDDAFYASFFGPPIFAVPSIGGVSNYTSRFRSVDEQLAGFANVDLRFGDVKASAGARVASSKFSFRENLDGPLNGGARTNLGNQKETPITPKFGITWQPDSTTLVYASASKGFRTGGANRPIAPTTQCAAALATLGLTAGPTEYKSDTVWSYEAGSKLTLVDGKVRVSGSVYHIDWKNIQQFVNLSGCSTGFVGNLGEATSNGLDLSVSVQPVRSLLLSVAAGYNRSRFAKTISTNGVILAEKGALVSDVPPWQVTTTLEYNAPARGGELYARVIDQYAGRNGGRYALLENPAASGYDPRRLRNDGYHSTSLRLGWRGDSFDLSVFADNLFNAHPVLNYVHATLPTDNTYLANSLQPRTIGLTLTARH